VIIDLREMQRPERTGAAAVLVLLFALYCYGEYIHFAEEVPEGANGSWFCTWAAFLCPRYVPTGSVAKAHQRHYHVITFLPGIGKKKICSCILQVRVGDKGVVINDENTERVSCDSDGRLEVPHNEWTALKAKPIVTDGNPFFSELVIMQNDNRWTVYSSSKYTFREKCE